MIEKEQRKYGNFTFVRSINDIPVEIGIEKSIWLGFRKKEEIFFRIESDSLNDWRHNDTGQLVDLDLAFIINDRINLWKYFQEKKKILDEEYKEIEDKLQK